MDLLRLRSMSQLLVIFERIRVRSVCRARIYLGGMVVAFQYPKKGGQ